MARDFEAELRSRLRMDATVRVVIPNRRRGVCVRRLHTLAQTQRDAQEGRVTLKKSRRRRERRELGNETCRWQENVEASWRQGTREDDRAK